MPSALASQLANIASLDAERLTSRTGAPSSKSYLFPASVAAEHDLDAVHALGASGFEELVQLDPGMEAFEDELFSDTARRTDRMMLSAEENAALDATLERCLRRLGRWIGIMAGGKCIEWLVRRFRVHEMNADALLQTFLPYHDSQNFARMLAILTLPQTSPYHAPFAPLVKKAQPVPREYITNAVSSARDPSLRLLGNLVGSVQAALEEGVTHRALLAFWSATLVDLIQRARTGAGGRMPEGVVKLFVEAFVNLLSAHKAGPEVNAAVYAPLVLLTRTIYLADAPFAAIADALLTPATGADPAQRLLTTLVVLDQRKSFTGFSDGAAAHLMAIPQLGGLLIAAMEKYGFETAMQAVVGALGDDIAASKDVLTTLVDHTNLPVSVVNVVAAKLLAAPAEQYETARALLSVLKQRHPHIIDNAVLEAGAVDPALIQWSSAETAFVDVHSADVSDRVSGVREMYAVAEAANLTASNAAELIKDDEDLKSAQTAIVARLRDTEPAVLEAVYAKPELLVALLAGKSYVDIVAPTFSAAKIELDALNLHLAFIGTHLTQSEDQRKVFELLLLPNLLATEERRVFGPEQWPAVVKACRLLDRVKGDMPLNASKEVLTKFNQDLIKNLATAIASSGDIGARVDVLVTTLTSPVRNARFLAALTLAQLMASAGGYQHVVAARSLAALETFLAGQALRDVQDIEAPLADNLIKAVVHKTSADKTQQRVYLALLTSAVAVPPSLNALTTWLGDVDASSSEGQTRTVAQALYRWANSSNLSTAVAKHLLHSVFTQLGEDVLVFLASVWTNPAAISTLRVAALRHAEAFVKAYTGAKATDFQLMIPATLIALQDEAKPVRQAAATLLRAISATPQSSSADLYALDSIYGSRSDLVQLLKPSDLTKYLETITKALDEMIVDAGRLALVHGQQLDLQSKNGKKDTLYRRDVVDWLMSHVLGWRADSSRRALLSSLDRAVNISCLQGALPLLEPLLDSSKDEDKWLASLPATHRAEYLELLFNSFNARNAAAVTAESGEPWKFLCTLVDKNAGTGLELRALSLQRMADGLFEALRPTQKVEYIVKLLQSLHALPVNDKFASKETLAQLPLSTVEVSSTIQALLEPLEASQPRGKKAKQDDVADTTEQAVADLTVFVTSRDWKALPGDANLVAVLMGVLSAVLSKRQSIKEGVDYLEQEVLGATLAQLEKIQDAAEIMRARVGIEVIVKVIRASSNPRTAQRALLVASELARLIPDSVLHNVMPIFTFMGSSEMQRDDAYSFGVVEKTVERIVPVMTASLKDKAATKHELYTQSLAFLSIFTDMANRLPKHRTLPFFVHLVKSLGADDFLAPVCMLLATRGKADAIELPLSIAAAFPPAVRTETLLEIVGEATRATEDEEEGATFLPAGEETASTLLLLGGGVARGLLGKVCPQESVEKIVRELIALAPELDDDEASEHLEAALGGVMRLLSVDSFLDITAQILATDTEADINRSLDLFSQRLALIKPELRQRSKSMPSIISKSAALLDGPSGQHALRALERVVATAIPSEDSALAAIVNPVVKAARAADAEGAAGILTLLSALVRRLGSRTIPFVQAILDACLSLIGSTEPLTAAAAFGALAALVETVPTFISSKQLVSLLGAAAAYRGADETASAMLIAAAAKRVPTKTLVPVVMDLWKAIKGGEAAPTEAFFALLRHTLRNADRKALPGLTKPLFAFFLDVFDLRHRAAAKLEPATVDRVETSAINSFLELVTKLSDSAFKPLFVRLYDWAVVDLSAGVADSHVIARRTVLLHVMDGLLDRFRHLLTPYMGTLLPLVDELLAAYKGCDIADLGLWTLLLSVLAKSMDVDDGAYWTDAGLLKLLPAVVAQLAVEDEELATAGAGADSPPAKTLASLAAATTSETTLKKVNGAVCLATRADEPKARMASLRALDAMWERHSDELIQFVPETVAEFLAELLEDDNSEVEGLARKVLARIEGVTGSLKEYLE
jgi:U3 small nucleolar RNA-associated protein 10